MSIFSLFTKQRTAPAARERLQVLLAHERSSTGSDLISVLREEILAVIAKHVQVDADRVHVKMDRDEHMSILEIDVEIPLHAAVKAA
ncbi:cell division topological specificity factor MinE [Rhizobium sp. Root1220]|uniref:cell division topological specificity factor MinE n=1 Tax=Rhizobium sp. Root1220 TaxID=1736432 RepID=UPI0006F61695|nr:cell division topological specificity factor MinE [Rhizobium sp. Root1220]KQV70351.1 cell division topological specificity factor [Rhizobium sp. Root1220]